MYFRPAGNGVSIAIGNENTISRGSQKDEKAYNALRIQAETIKS